MKEIYIFCGEVSKCCKIKDGQCYATSQYFKVKNITTNIKTRMIVNDSLDKEKLTTKYGITAFPIILLMKDGAVARRIQGKRLDDVIAHLRDLKWI